MQQYKSLYQVFAIWAINNFIAHKIFYVRIGISSDSYKYHTTNNFEQLIEEEEGSEIMFIIITSILRIIDMHIRPIGFLKAVAPKVLFDTDGKILEGLVIVEEICAKLIFGRSVSLDLGDYCKFKAACTANREYNIIEAKKEHPKTKAKQLKNKKQQQKRIEEKRKFANRQFSRPRVR